MIWNQHYGEFYRYLRLSKNVRPMKRSVFKEEINNEPVVGTTCYGFWNSENFCAFLDHREHFLEFSRIWKWRKHHPQVAVMSDSGETDQMTTEWSLLRLSLCDNNKLEFLKSLTTIPSYLKCSESFSKSSRKLKGVSSS